VSPLDAEDPQLAARKAEIVWCHATLREDRNRNVASSPNPSDVGAGKETTDRQQQECRALHRKSRV
jgi:hypothetical protein